MSEIAWFTLLLRAIGLLVLVEQTPGLIGYVAYLPSIFATDMPVPALMQIGAVATLAGYAASVAFGLYLLLDGRRVVRFCIRDLVARCAVCGYPLAKITGSVCPECGVPIHTPADAQTANDQESS